MLLNTKIGKAIEVYNMEELFEGAIVGFSGGADSSALVHYLKDKTKNLLCVHINHLIRGEEALRDEYFCRSVCEKYGVRFASFRVDIPALSEERHKGIEETAREERYRIFRGLLEQHPEYKCIVTAHTANDNAETVLFNLTRGSGANGVSGIRPVLGNIVRPLIYATREDILEYCTENNVEYVHDSTNNDTDYTRNYIRHNVVPALEKINPNLVEACTRLSETLREDREYFDKKVDELFENEQIKDKLSLELAQNLEMPILTRTLIRLSCDKLDYKSIQSCIKLIKNGKTGKLVNLAHGISFKIERGYAKFIKSKELEKIEFSYKLEAGLTYLKEIDTYISLNDAEAPNGYYEVCSMLFCAESLKGELTVRNKVDGDTIYHGKMTKKLKKMMADKHIPSHYRAKMPIVCDEDGVVAVPSLAIRDGAKGKDVSIKVYIKKTDAAK
ncbi:MAG: tRNA lysidine(34) synthetase TilS [Clostridia bacterium]|nr:tRNA lysidine(34) synthetase TilS [Clostridia bacterium]